MFYGVIIPYSLRIFNMVLRVLCYAHPLWAFWAQWKATWSMFTILNWKISTRCPRKTSKLFENDIILLKHCWNKNIFWSWLVLTCSIKGFKDWSSQPSRGPKRSSEMRRKHKRRYRKVQNLIFDLRQDGHVRKEYNKQKGNQTPTIRRKILFLS